QTEYPVDDRGYPGQVVHRDANDAGDQALLGVLTQIYCCQHAEGRDHHRHDQHHQHGTENGREHAALGVGLTGLVTDELPQLGEVMAGLVQGGHGVGLDDPHNLAEVDFLLAAVRHPHGQAVATELLIQRRQVTLQRGIFVVQRGALGVQFGLPLRGEFVVQLIAALAQTHPLQARVDATDIGLFQLLDVIVDGQGAIHRLLQRRPGVGAGGNDLAVLPHIIQVAIEVTPLAPLDDDDLFRRADVFHPVADHPAEIRAVQITVTYLDELALHAAIALRVHRHAGTGQPGRGYLFAGVDLTEDNQGLLPRHAVLGLDPVRGPEVAQPAYGDQDQQPQGHDHGNGNRAGVHPDPRATA